MIRPVPLLLAVAALIAQDGPTVVPMGYGHLGADGQPQDVVVALTRAQFAALVAAAANPGPAAASEVRSAIGPGGWSGIWRDGQWHFSGRIPAAALGATWGDLRLRMPGTVTAVRLEALSGATIPPAPAWRVEDGSLALALPPGSQAMIAVECTLAAPNGNAVELAFPAGGTLAIDTPAGLVALSGGRQLASSIGLPVSGSLTVAIGTPGAAAGTGSLGLEQRLRLRHLGDRIAFAAEIGIDGQLAAPTLVELTLPGGLAILNASGDDLAGWRQVGDQLELRWGAANASNRIRHVSLGGAITGEGGVAPLLRLPGAARGSGSVGFATDGWPGTWSQLPAGDPWRQRFVNADPGEGFRLAWTGTEPGPLALTYTPNQGTRSMEETALLVVGPDRWRAELALRLHGSHPIDHLRLNLPRPWRVVSVEGADHLLDGEAVILRAAAPFAADARLVVRLEAPPEGRNDTRLPDFTFDIEGKATYPRRWLIAERGPVRAGSEGTPTDADAVAAELARAGVHPRADERVRMALQQRRGETPLRVTAEERHARIEAAHYVIAGSGAARWSTRVTVRPEQGSLDAVRIRLPAGTRLVDRRGEAVSSWSESDGWLTAAFAAPLDRPTTLELTFTADWGVAAGRDRLDLTGLATEPALASESIALAEDEEAGQLIRTPDGLEERPATAVPLPAGVATPLLAGRTWTATGTAWHLALERERLDPGMGADGIATLVDAHSSIDPDGRLVSRATWYVINRTRSALTLALPEGCQLWEVRVGGQPVRARNTDRADQITVPLVPLRPGEAVSRIQVSWCQAAGGGDLLPRLPAFEGLKVMRALWRFTAPPGTHLAHVAGWEPVAAGDATGARVEVLADELKHLRATGEGTASVRGRLEDQLRLIDQELTDQLAVLENLGQDPSRWTSDVVARKANQEDQQSYNKRNGSANVFLNDNRQQLKTKLAQIGNSSKVQHDRRGGLLLDSQTIRWAADEAPADLGPDWAARRLPAPLPANPGTATGGALGVGNGTAGNGVSAALTGVDLLPDQAGEELSLRADGLGAQPVLRLTAAGGTGGWMPWLLGLGAAALLGLGLLRRK